MSCLKFSVHYTHTLTPEVANYITVLSLYVGGSVIKSLNPNATCYSPGSCTLITKYSTLVIKVKFFMTLIDVQLYDRTQIVSWTLKPCHDCYLGPLSWQMLSRKYAREWSFIEREICRQILAFDRQACVWVCNEFLFHWAVRWSPEKLHWIGWKPSLAQTR